jgi:hypothetical protein
MKRRVAFAVTSLILLAEGLRGYRPVLSAEKADEAGATVTECASPQSR